MLDLPKTGSFISEMRKEKGLTQKQLADLVGVSDKAVSRWETGKGLPDTSIMPELCKALDININELLSGERLNAEVYSGKAEEIMVDLVKDVQNNSKAAKSEIVGLVVGVLLLLIGLVGVMVVGGSQIAYYIDLPSVIMVLAIQLIILASGGQIGSFIKSFKVVFRKKTMSEGQFSEEVPKCEYAIKYAQKAALLGGAISSIIGFVTVFAIVWRKDYEVLGPNMAVAVLTLFYGLLFTLILMPIQGRLHNMK